MPQDSASNEDYLEAIASLTEENGYANTTAIARLIGVKMPSVSSALKVLAGKGYVTYAPYKPVKLTAEGRAVARRIARRHALLRRFLTDALGLQKLHADALACRMEHAFDEVAYKRLDAFMRDFAPTPPAPKRGAGR